MRLNIQSASESLTPTTGTIFPDTRKSSSPASGSFLLSDKFVKTFAEVTANPEFVDIDDFIEAEESVAEKAALLKQARMAIGVNLTHQNPMTIANLRLKAGMSQLQVAEAIGNSQPSYSNIENGRTDFKVSTAIKIAKVLGVSIEELIAVVEINQENKQCQAHI